MFFFHEKKSNKETHVQKFAWIQQKKQERNTAAHQVARADLQYRATEQQVANAQRQKVSAGTHCSFMGLNYQPDNFINMTDVGVLGEECAQSGALNLKGKQSLFVV